MPSSFSVSAAAPTVPLDRGHGTAEFTVTNVSAVPVRGRLAVVPLPPARAAWLALDGEGEREFAPNQSEAVRVKVAVPAGANADDYPFRLNVYATANPDADYAEGPVVTFSVPKPPPPPPPPWKLIFGLLAAVAAAAVIALAVVLWPKAPPAKVPDVTKLSADAAKAKLEAAGLKVAVQEVVTDAEPGTVIGQDPPADADRPADGTVTLTVEASLVDVPLLDGKTQAEAEAELDKRQLEFLPGPPVLTADPAQAGRVKEQSPRPAGSQKMFVRRGTSVTVTLHQDGVRVPPLAGKVWTDPATRKLLTDAGLEVGLVGTGVGPPGTPPNTVLDTDPGPNTLVPRRSTVNVAVARPPATVPKVVGDQYSVALDKLREQGMTADVTKQPPLGFPTVVLTQHPAAGDPLPAGQKVKLTVATKPFVFDVPGGVIKLKTADLLVDDKLKFRPITLPTK